MISRDVTVEIDGIRKIAKFECDRKTNTMKVYMPDKTARTYTDTDLYLCLGKVRQDFPKVKFLCKGSKVNVHPSRMSSQMSGGIVAYEVTIGKPANEDEIVNILDYEEQDLTSEIGEQINYYQRWLQSLEKIATQNSQNNPNNQNSNNE